MDKKNAIILTVIATATLLVTMIGATFAYFTAQTGGGTNADVTVTTSSSDSLEYGSFKPIVINANQTNFGKGMGDQKDSTTGNVTLKANKNAAATYCYTVSLNVTANNLEYTTETKTPELTFTISKKTGSEETVVIYNDHDITELAAGNKALTIPVTTGGTELIHKITAAADTTTSDVWTATVTLVNLNTDQQANTNKSFVGALEFATTECPSNP